MRREHRAGLAGARLACCLASLLAGCHLTAREDGPGDGGARPDGGGAGASAFVAISGGRLKARFVEGPGGARSLLDWYDNQLQTGCSFRIAVDGELRCLPYGTILSPPDDYADPACTALAVVDGTADCELWSFVRRQDDSGGCGIRERIYRRGERITENRTFWRPNGGSGACVAAGLREGAAAYKVGPELPPGMFVKATTVVQPSTKAAAALDIVLLEAQDGARSYWGWQNAMTQTRCDLWAFPDQRRRCVPDAANISTISFEDATCNQPAAYFQTACASQPAVAMQPVKDVCPLVYTPVTLGPRLDGIYRRSDGTCGPSPLQVDNEYRALGEPAPEESFPLVDVLTETSSARLYRQIISAPGGRRAVSDEWFDADRQETCYATSFGPAGYRCVPWAPALGSLYADDQCTQPVWQALRGRCPPGYALRWDFTTCPAHPTVFKLGAEHGGPVFIQYNIAEAAGPHYECTPYTPPASDGEVVFLSTSPVDAAEFEPMKLVVSK